MKKIIGVLFVISLFYMTSCITIEPTVTEAIPTAAATTVTTDATTTEPTAEPAEPTEAITPEPTADPTPEPTMTPTPMPELATQGLVVVTGFDYLHTLLPSGTKVYAHKGGSGRVEWDLNRDGTREDIQIVFYNAAGKSIAPFDVDLDDAYANYDRDVSRFEITMGGVMLTVSGECIEPILMLVDVDSSDGQLELIVGRYGPSSDYFTTVMRCQGGTPVQVGYVPGIARGKLKVDGSGVVTTRKRGEILQTWFYDATYGYSGGSIQQIEQDTYPMGTEVTLLMDLQLVTSPTNSTPAGTLHAGDEAVIVSSDDVAWCYIEGNNGVSGWFEVTGFDNIGGHSGYEVFDGLNYAD